MPVKKRISKRRADGNGQELAAWRELFEVGYDFFGDLEPFGFPPAGAPFGDADRAAREAAGEVWARLGAAFMETWEPTETCKEPWALQQFGKPWERKHAR